MEQEYIPAWIRFKQKCEQIKNTVVNKGLTFLLIIILILLILSLITGYKPLFVMSPSMEPAIMTHQFILAKKVHDSGHDMDIGDIITYKLPDGVKTITHRIIQMEDDGYIVKGDNNAEADPYTVRPEWILYKIVAY